VRAAIVAASIAMASEKTFDCIVIGAGPAGLTAAIYLARFRRDIVLLDAGRSRAAQIPVTHNFPGYPDGIAGTALLQVLTRQAERYGAAITPGEVSGMRLRADGSFEVTTVERAHHAHTVLLATGCVDIAPDWPGITDAVRGGYLRYCPICDGFEVVEKNVAVLGNGTHAAREALFVQHFTPEVTLLTGGGPLQAAAAQCEQLRCAGIAVLEDEVQKGFVEDGGFVCCLAGERRLAFDSLYLALGCRMRSALATAQGARCSDEGELVVDAHMQTSVSGLYAAGDVVKALNQIAVATGQAAIAATDIHNRLRAQELERRTG
jgi:thioredoxin reductase (NADPH)